MQQNLSILHATARAYAEAGIPVFPCEVGGKKPVTENGFYDSTTDLSTIDAWWCRADYNVAFCPDYANLFVVDIDPGADKNILQRFPVTYRVRTPRGGWHLYFEGSGRSSSNKIAAHVDTRGQGGYVLVPPSRINGHSYLPETDVEYAPVPSWVAAALHAPDTPLKAAVEDMDLPVNVQRAVSVLERYVKRGDVAVEGAGGDDRTYRLCCELLDLGLSEHKALQLIEEIWNPHCEPPWTTEELETKLYNASQFMQNEAGAYATQPAQDVFGELIRDIGHEPQKLSRFHFRDEGELDNEPDPKWLVQDLISERSTVMLYGPSGSYKSFLAMEICLALATGMSTFGSDTKPGLVFYGALEGRAHLRKARRAWKVLKGVDGRIDNFFLGFAPMIAVEGEMQEFGDEIAKRCAGRRPALIVIDTLTKAMAGLNENDAKDAGKFIRFCDSLVEAFGCTVLAIHHTGKDEDRGARGSSAFLAGFDTVLEVRAHKPTKAVAVHVRKHKDAEEREHPWTFEGRITGPSLTFQMTTFDEHRQLTGDSKAVTPKTIGAALKELKAFGEDNAVSTAVLAAELTPQRENESVEARGEAINRTGRVLAAGARGQFEAYCFKHGRGFMWHLPAPKEGT